MNQDHRKEIASIRSKLDDLRADIEWIQSNEQEYYDRMPESFQSSDKGSIAESAISALDSAMSHIDDACGELDTASE